MKKSSYLRAVAAFELVALIAGIVVYIISMVISFNQLKDMPESSTKGWTIFTLILGLVLILFFGPAMYILLSSVADLLDSNEANYLAYKKTPAATAANNAKYGRPVVQPRFHKGQSVKAKKDLEDHDGNQVPRGCYGIVMEAEPNAFPKVKFKPSSSEFDIIMKVEPGNLEEWK